VLWQLLSGSLASCKLLVLSVMAFVMPPLYAKLDGLPEESKVEGFIKLTVNVTVYMLLYDRRLCNLQ
jgi:hypothetical protein